MRRDQPARRTFSTAIACVLLGAVVLVAAMPLCAHVPVSGDVQIVERPAKVCQLTGDIDRQTGEPTRNRTGERYKLFGTDLGVPVRHKGRTYLLFGDTVGERGGDAMAWTADRSAEQGLHLTFPAKDGAYLPVSVPGIGQAGFEVPMAGASVGGKLYIYHTTDHSPGSTMGRSVVAVSEDDGPSCRLLYDLSRKHFINVSLSQVAARSWPGLPMKTGRALLLFGSGSYRRSDVRLACQPESDVASGRKITYLSGLAAGGTPRWSSIEDDAVPLFAHPVVGELSVVWNRFLERWVMLYNSGEPRGIVLRTARRPWGPWSDAQVLFNPWLDGGYGRFMHISKAAGGTDALSDPGRENEWGGEYGPYQLGNFATGKRGESTLYFTMSTWNPYQVVLMRAKLAVRKALGEPPPKAQPL